MPPRYGMTGETFAAIAGTSARIAATYTPTKKIAAKTTKSYSTTKTSRVKLRPRFDLLRLLYLIGCFRIWDGI